MIMELYTGIDVGTTVRQDTAAELSESTARRRTGPRARSGMRTGTRPGTPSILARLWADQAANGLRRRAPSLSAHGRSHAWLGILVAAALLSSLATLPVAGTVFLRIPALLCVPAFAALTVLRFAATCLPVRWAPRRDLPCSVLPPASLMIALYDEAEVLPDLIAALDRIDYPADRLQIMLVLEETDRRTRAALDGVRLGEHYEVIIVPPGTPQTKPRALNYALRFCSGRIVGVHDAEDRPHPQQLKTAAESFAAAGAELACLQAPLNWYNHSETWLTRQFAMEYAAHFHALLPLYRRLGWPLPLGGTSNYFRADTVRRAGGWDAWNVTEDADLGVRLHALGYRCNLIEPMTLEEAPVTLRAWLPQRTRWLKGYLQTLGVHAGLDPNRRAYLLPLVLTLGGTVLSALAHGPAAIICLYTLATGGCPEPLRPLYGGLLLLGYLASVCCILRGMKRAGLRPRLLDLIRLPLYWPCQGWAAARALYQQAAAPYVWEKTRHGVSAMAGRTCPSPSSPPSPDLRSVSCSSSSPAGGQCSRPARNGDHG